METKGRWRGSVRVSGMQRIANIGEPQDQFSEVLSLRTKLESDRLHNGGGSNGLLGGLWLFGGDASKAR